MNLYNLTLQHPTAITCAAVGSFTQDRAQEVALVREHILEIIQINSNGVAKTVAFTDVFGIIRDIKAFRIPGLLMIYYLQLFNKCSNYFLKVKNVIVL